MAVLQSCCCWRSVRKGSFACGIYTMLYFIVNAIMSSILLHEELLYFRNATNSKPPASFIDQDTLSLTSMCFTVLFLCISSAGIVTSLLLLYGLYRDKRLLLIPWISTMVVFVFTDVAHSAYMFIEHTLKVNPSTAILFTVDLFIITLNIYAFLCVMSQYQELKAGRGRAIDDQRNRIQNIHYNAQPTATSYLSSKRAITCHETRPTPTQSPTGTAPQTSLAAEDASPSASSKGARKTVKFEGQNGAQATVQPWTIDVKTPVTLEVGGDMMPLIESGVEQPLQTAM